jgi:hypothetical protein
MMGRDAPIVPVEDAPSSPRKVARLVVAQDAIAVIGLATGIVVSAISIWLLLRKYQTPPPSGS